MQQPESHQAVPDVDEHQGSGFVIRFHKTPNQVSLLNHMASDLDVVNAARASFGKHSTELGDADIRLIGFLAKNQHFSPFRHSMFRLQITAPEFVMRQLYKHVVGIEGTSSYATKDHAWSELSTRFRPVFDVYMPVQLKQQHASAKQCSGEPLPEPAQSLALSRLRHGLIQTFESYAALIAAGVSREQARMLLPLNFLTTVTWTASLQAIFHFVQLRDSSEAQEEIRWLARDIERLVQPIVPHSWYALKATLHQ